MEEKFIKVIKSNDGPWEIQGIAECYASFIKLKVMAAAYKLARNEEKCTLIIYRHDGGIEEIINFDKSKRNYVTERGGKKVLFNL